MLKSRVYQLVAVVIYSMVPDLLLAEKKITAYFSNDSVNGLLISDAYETHNMGIIIDNGQTFVSLDLGIVSPDMHIYKNEYRVANRSFGELITLSYGTRNQFSDKIHHRYFGQVKTSGKFGIDKMQDMMHRILNLQPVNEVNDIVRMPNETWIGIGGELQYFSQDDVPLFNQLGARYYIGTDRSEVTPYAKKSFITDKILFSGEIGVRAVFYDEIVSAPPIAAEPRSIIPYAEIGLNFEYFGFNWYVKDKFSLPTINEDNGLFGLLTAGVSIDLE